MLKLDPGPHSRTFLKSFHTDQTPQFCASCHKVHLDVPVNAYRWIRGFNEYDNWQASGVSGEGARSFYYPPKPQGCADCHMPLVTAKDPAARDGKVHSHRFPGANTALPFVNRDAEQMEVTQAFLKSGAVTIDVFGLVPGEPERRETRAVAGGEPRLSTTFAAGEESMSFGAAQAFVTPAAEVVAPLDKVDAALRRGDSARLDVVVRTRRVGHFFPGGTVDAFDVWVELEVVDSNGKKIFHSGSRRGTDGRGPVEPGAHFYRSLSSTSGATSINKRNAWATRSVAYVRLIPPGAADTVHYRLRIPEDCGDRITVKAKLNYRKFAWWNTQWAFAGVRDPEHQGYSIGPGHDDGRWVFTGDTSGVSGKVKAIPDIPITVMDEAEAAIRVLPKGAPEPKTPPFLDASVRERWNDYGIGLLLQGDLKGAEAAFLKVTKMEPSYADGWVNVGRARLTEGDLAGAEESLRKALEVDPGLAKTHFFLGTALKQSGRYDEALAAPSAGGGALPAGPRGAEPDRPAPLPEAAVPRGDRRAEAGARDRPRGPAGALQSDAQLPGSRRQRDGEEARGALPALQGGRVGPDDHRALPPAAPPRQQRAAGGARARLGPRGRPRLPKAVRAGAARRRRASAGPAGASRARGPPMSAPAPARARAAARPRPGRRPDPVRRAGSSSRTAPPTPASPSVTTRAPSARSTCRRPWARASPSSTTTTTAGSTCSSRTRRSGRASRGRRPPPPSTATTGTAPSPTSRRRPASPPRCSRSASTAADYDNDGWKDLYVTAIGGNHLFRNLGNGTFADVTAKTGTKGPGTFGTSTMFFDYDKDGNLDIVVANYVTWTVEKDLFCTLDGKTKSYCTPESYKGESPTLFRNRGDGTFEDATRKAGLWDPTSKALGVALLDHDDDGWPDFVLANDTQPNKLYRNNHDGTFTDVGTTAGIAFGETGVARAGMGVDSARLLGRRAPEPARSPTSRTR